MIGGTTGIGLETLGSLLLEEAATPKSYEAFRASAIRPYRARLLDLTQAAQGAVCIRNGTFAETAVEMLIGSYYAQTITGQVTDPNWAHPLLIGSGLLTRSGRVKLPQPSCARR